ncbi:ferredoxin [Methanomicrobium sp. W14]|uniref:4Fe-4S binding protein n=1 Tax=Methanomicrobium sp. W14 TaxID=2817839 RepID=UPI001AE6E330|nr:4Fe-4S binding protein [Methanomicrobium sp. W14]MBP2132116.1 ferredoxin [Methanomicrobium sp. W14]
MLRVKRISCFYCGTCVAICPRANLELIDSYLFIGKDCAECGICAGVCPVGALEVLNEEQI